MIFNQELQIQFKNHEVVNVRPAVVQDVSAVTKLIRNAFEIWKEKGFRFGPMLQTDLQTEKHLLGKGFVARNENQEIIGTFSVDIGKLKKSEGKVIFTEGKEGPLVFSPIIEVEKLIFETDFLIFKKAAVRRDVAGFGLGLHLYKMAESIARKHGFAGMLVETVYETQWLYNWYVKLGYEKVGSYRYSNGQVDTVLMIKLF